MKNRIVCPFYSKNDDFCDIGCGYISPSDVRVIIQFCSSHHQGCPKFQELAARYPDIDLSPLDALPSPVPVAEATTVPARVCTLEHGSGGRPPTDGTPCRPSHGAAERTSRLPQASEVGACNLAPLGLLGFGMTLILFSLQHTGLFPMDPMILGMAIFYGGTAQVAAGVMEWKKSHTFGVIAYSSYGLFWLSLVAMIILPGTGFGHPPTPAAMGAYLAMWGLFSALLFIATLRLSRALQLVFSSLTLFFILQAAGEASAHPIVKACAGYQGIACGLLALYTGAAQVINEIYGRTVAPLGAIKKA